MQYYMCKPLVAVCPFAPDGNSFMSVQLCHANVSKLHEVVYGHLEKGKIASAELGCVMQFKQAYTVLSCEC